MVKEIFEKSSHCPLKNQAGAFVESPPLLYPQGIPADNLTGYPQEIIGDFYSLTTCHTTR